MQHSVTRAIPLFSFSFQKGGPCNPRTFATLSPKDQIRARICLPSIHSNTPQWGTFLARDSVEALTAYIPSLE